MTRFPSLAKPAAVILGCLPLLAQAVIRAPTVPDLPAHVDLDGSAFTSLAYRFEHGSISGRDFAHTYGPLAQALTWVAVNRHESRDYLSGLPLILIAFWAANVVLLAVLLLLMPGLGWKDVLVVLLLLGHFEIPAHYPSFRPLTAMVAVLVTAHAARVARRPARWAVAVLAGALCTGAQLLTVEAGLCALVSSVGALLLGVSTAVQRTNPPAEGAADASGRSAHLETLAVLLSSFAALQLLLALGLTSVVGARDLLTYHRGALRIATGYALTMSAPWSLPAVPTLGLAAAALLTWGMALVRATRSNPLERQVLWGLTILSILHTKSALTRSDLGHILLGFTPTVVLWALLGKRFGSRPLPQASWWLAFAVLLLAWPAQGMVWRELGLVATGRLSLHSRWTQARRFALAQARLLPTSLLEALPRGAAPVLVLPFQNQLAVALGRPLIGGVHQSYAAHTVELQRELIGEIQSAGPDLDVLVVQDGAARLDGVDTLSRLPLVFEHLLEEFRLRPATAVDRGTFALQRRTASSGLRRRPLGQARGNRESAGSFVLAASTECSLVELRVDVRYPWWHFLARPEPLVARVFQDDRLVVERRLVPLTAAGEFTTLVSLVPEAEVYRLFADNPPAGRAWNRLELVSPPSDVLAIAPISSRVIAAACVSGSGTAN